MFVGGKNTQWNSREWRRQVSWWILNTDQ